MVFVAVDFSVVVIVDFVVVVDALISHSGFPSHSVGGNFCSRQRQRGKRLLSRRRTHRP